MTLVPIRVTDSLEGTSVPSHPRSAQASPITGLHQDHPGRQSEVCEVLEEEVTDDDKVIKLKEGVSPSHE
ncbi:hypothetical protein LIER_13971 [Lithospermum erythrorhizon]|uniref:Uncharacterized protein n=1 Tax=Lithospermum erythrorhizon TaxID=34254 RepID=A0AAV3PYY6_LITER